MISLPKCTPNGEKLYNMICTIGTMSTKKIYLEKYFDTIIASDLTLKECVGDIVAMNFLDETLQCEIHKIRANFLRDIEDSPSVIFNFLQYSFRAEVCAERNIEHLENVYKIRPFLLVDEKFYDKYHKYLSKYLNM